MACKVAGRAVVTVLCAVALCQAATLDRYPYLQNLRGDRATVLWTTRDPDPGVGVVQFSTDLSFSRGVAAGVQAFLPADTGRSFTYYQYSAELTGLSPGTDYFYRVLIDGQDMTPADRLRLRTAGPGPFTFLLLGDSGTGSTAQRLIAQRMLEESSPALVLHAGDIAYESGTFLQFAQNYFGIYKDLMKRVPFFTTPGNHDYVTNFATPYLAVHAPPTDTVPLADQGRYYSFDWGNVHFISLDSNVSLANAVNGTGAMFQWLESDVQKTKQTWKVVFFHHPPYLIFNHEDDAADALVRSNLLPILDKYPIDLVLNGHEHNYQRTYPLRGGKVVEDGLGATYVISGGGGADLHPVFPDPLRVFSVSAYHYLRIDVQGARMTVQAIGADKQLLDSFTLEPRLLVGSDPPSIPSGSVVNAASFAPSLAPGALVSIFGSNLAVRENQALSLPLPIQLSGTNVSVNGRRLPLLFVSPGQVNAQMPFDALGQTALTVTTPNGSAETQIMVSETAPGIFTLSPAPAVLHSNGSLVTAASPAKPGEALSIFLTGLGAVNGQIDAGQPAPVPPLTVRAPVTVQLESLSVTPSFAGLAPGFAGLYQVNWQIPAGLAAGNHTLRVMARGISSEPVTLAVQ